MLLFAGDLFSVLMVQVLDHQDITHAGVPPQGLCSLCPAVVDLDLSNNLIDNWGEVLILMEHLPHMKFLNIARNPLKNKEVRQLHVLFIILFQLAHCI